MTKLPSFKICTIDDIPQILEIFKKSYIQHYTYQWHDSGENYMKNSFTPEKMQEEMNEENSRFYLIYDEALPVGILKINNEKSIEGERSVDNVEIERIYFVKEAAGKGLGKSTLKMVEELALQEKKRVIWLKAMKEADAVKFYEKQGFLVTGETELAYPLMKEEYKKQVVMQLILQ